ncbi:MAG: MogA/MoaB family molybdenum cofactor biosynthesis protein [Deltaproteobacteria bacterium]|nr:MogA/MoaB family molybdenum cofactor biosynthesis protein [Deltaproteobacteria bacterium]
MGLSQHRAAAFEPAAVRVAVLSVSDTRTRETDLGGALVEALTAEAGFCVLGRDIIPDDPDAIRARIRALCQEPFDTTRQENAVANAGDAAPVLTKPDVVLLTGGTGIAPRDGTVEALAPLFERRLDGFGELFRMLSFAEVGAAAMLSRACAGIVRGGVAVFLMPGSPAAIRLAMQRLILPELGHLVAELRKQPDRADRADSAAHAANAAQTEAVAHAPDAPQGHHRHGTDDHHRH